MIDPIARVPLGRTKVRVSRLGFGSTGLGGLFRASSDADAKATIDAAWDAGLRHYDTAPQYGSGLAETRVGAGLRARPRDEFVLSTKIGKLLRAVDRAPEGIFVGAPPFEIAYDYSYDGTLRSLEESLKRIGLDRVDVLLIHDVNRKYHGARVMERLDEALAGACKALGRLRDEGVIGAFGPALNEVDVNIEFVRRAPIDCIMLPARYTLLDQSAGKELLPLCAREKISVMIAAPFDSGILATGAVEGATYNYQPATPEILDRVARIERICREHAVPLAAAALQFPLRHPAVANVVTGMRAPEEVAQNLTLMRTDICDALWIALARERLI
ncbi:MAG TPA: aldo/keto reductase [Alphaproteobacteria bacterium]|nr:aldo/keto reductase [Alphaproteobacteria bacterium]